VSVSAPTVAAGDTVTVTLTAVDAFGNPETSSLTVGFGLGAGSPGGTFGLITNHGNGVYTVPFTPTAAGTDTIVATINGQLLTSAAPTVAVPVAPAGTITTVTPTFSWPAVANTDHYVLTVTDTARGLVVLSLPRLPAAVYALTPAQALTPGHGYTWTAQAVSPGGRVTTVSSAVRFSVAPLGAPAPLAPSGPTATDTPTLTWAAVTDAAHAAADHFTVKVTDKGTGQTLTIANVTGTSYRLSAAQALTPGHTYTWSVTALSSNGQASAASGAGSNPTFTVEKMAAPVASSPTGTLAVDRPTFTWTPLVNALYTAPGSYTLKVMDRATGQSLSVGKLTGTSYTLTAAQALTPGHSFTWSVTAVSSNGLATTAGTSANFTIAALSAPVLIGVSKGTFTWQPVTDASHYYLQIKDGVTGQVVVSVPAVAGTSFTLSPAQAGALKRGRSYTWLVGAVSTNGKVIVWSRGQEFTAPA
jgi:hypothetical protein